MKRSSEEDLHVDPNKNRNEPDSQPLHYLFHETTPGISLSTTATTGVTYFTSFFLGVIVMEVVCTMANIPRSWRPSGWMEYFANMFKRMCQVIGHYIAYIGTFVVWLNFHILWDALYDVCYPMTILFCSPLFMVQSYVDHIRQYKAWPLVFCLSTFMIMACLYFVVYPSDIISHPYLAGVVSFIGVASIGGTVYHNVIALLSSSSDMSTSMPIQTKNGSFSKGAPTKRTTTTNPKWEISNIEYS